jgi:hypothetical protein
LYGTFAGQMAREAIGANQGPPTKGTVLVVEEQDKNGMIKSGRSTRQIARLTGLSKYMIMKA